MTPKRSALLIYLATAPVAAQSLGDAPQIFLDEPRVETKAFAAAPPPPDRASVVRLYHTRFLPAEVTTSGWAGNVGNCTQGTTSSAFKQSVLDRINSYRAFADTMEVKTFFSKYLKKGARVLELSTGSGRRIILLVRDTLFSRTLYGFKGPF